MRPMRLDFIGMRIYFSRTNWRNDWYILRVQIIAIPLIVWKYMAVFIIAGKETGRQKTE